MRSDRVGIERSTIGFDQTAGGEDQQVALGRLGVARLEEASEEGDVSEDRDLVVDDLVGIDGHSGEQHGLSVVEGHQSLELTLVEDGHHIELTVDGVAVIVTGVVTIPAAEGLDRVGNEVRVDLDQLTSGSGTVGAVDQARSDLEAHTQVLHDLEVRERSDVVDLDTAAGAGLIVDDLPVLREGALGLHRHRGGNSDQSGDLRRVEGIRAVRLIEGVH